MKYPALIAALVILLSGQALHAESSDSLDVARTQGDITCQIQKSDETNVNCTTNISEQAHLSIPLTAMTNGFVGSNKNEHNGNTYVLAVVTDASKAIKDIVLVRGTDSTPGSFDGSVAITESSSLAAVLVDPIHFEKVDEDTYNFHLSFISYASAERAAAMNPQMMGEHLSKKMRPLFMALAK